MWVQLARTNVMMECQHNEIQLFLIVLELPRKIERFIVSYDSVNEHMQCKKVNNFQWKLQRMKT